VQETRKAIGPSTSVSYPDVRGSGGHQRAAAPRGSVYMQVPGWGVLQVVAIRSRVVSSSGTGSRRGLVGSVLRHRKSGGPSSGKQASRSCAPVCSGGQAEGRARPRCWAIRRLACRPITGVRTSAAQWHRAQTTGRGNRQRTRGFLRFCCWTGTGRDGKMR
jgi:hypothetical protein